MDDLISRQAAIDALDVLCQEHRYKIPGKIETYSQYNEAWQDALDRAEGAIFNLPSAQPERKKGKWIYDGDCYICDQCKSAFGWWADSQTSNYCPNCGADMLESAQFEERKESLCKKVRALCEESKIEFFFVGGGESTWSVTNDKHIKKIVECHKAQLSQEGTEECMESHACDLISRQAAIEALEQIRYALWEIDILSPTVPEYIEHHRDVQNVMKRIGEIRDKMERLPSAQPERTCVNCGRTVINGGWYADGRTRCPIEEHYALPKDGYCHLWEKRSVTDDDCPERREDEH